MKINTHVLLAEIDGIELVDHTKKDWYYCMVENGAIFKYCDDYREWYYQLDLERFVWIKNQSFVSLTYDTYLRYQEIPGFRDYFPHEDKT